MYTLSNQSQKLKSKPKQKQKKNKSSKEFHQQPTTSHCKHQNNYEELNRNDICRQGVDHKSAGSFSSRPSNMAREQEEYDMEMQQRSFETGSWYHFDEYSMSWLPVGTHLQEMFDMQYLRIRDNRHLRSANPHFTFQISDCWYGIRFDFTKNGVPFGEQYKLNCRGTLRNIIKARPDIHRCIHGIPVGDY